MTDECIPTPRSGAWRALALTGLLLNAAWAQEPPARDAQPPAIPASAPPLPAKDLPHPPSSVAFENAPGVLGISIRTLRKESVKAYASESLGVVALGLEDIRLTPVAKDGNIAVNLGEQVAFDDQTHSIQKTSRRLLDGISRLLAENPDTLVHIINHTDDQGDAGYNRRLSQRRADAIKDYLVGRGVAAERLIAVGQGESAPLITTGKRTPTRKERGKNRRTELLIEHLDAPEPDPEPDLESPPESTLEADTDRGAKTGEGAKGGAQPDQEASGPPRNP